MCSLFSDDKSSCPLHAFTGKRPSASVFRVFGSLAYVTLDHELNQSAKRLQKAGERASPGILLTYGRDGTVFDRRRPGWVVHVPEYHMPKPIITPHVTVLEHIRPSPALLRQLTFTAPHEIDRTPISMRVTAEGDVEQAMPHFTRASGDDDDGLVTPPPAAGAMQRPITIPVPTPMTIAHRMSRTTTGPYGRQSANGVAGSITTTSPVSAGASGSHPVAPHVAHAPAPVPAVPPIVPPEAHASQSDHISSRLRSGDPILAAWEFCGVMDDASFDPACTVEEYDSINLVDGKYTWVPNLPKLITSMPAYVPSACNDDQSLFMGAPEEDVLHSLFTDTSEFQVRRRMSQGVPVRTVRYPWGDVPYELAAEWDNSIMFHTEVDCTVDSHIYTSLESGDDPTYAQAMRGPERKQWVDAREDEMNALRDLGVIVLTPADAVPLDEDIYDTMALCKRKRGELSVLLKHKLRIVLCGNQVVAATARRENLLGTDRLPPLRTHSPTVRHCTYKLVTGAAVCRRMRRRGFDVKWAYLQGDGKFMGKKVWARAPIDCRQYDERGVEYVWEVVKPLYGGPDSGRAWYLTFATWLMSPAGMEFLRCDADACLFDRVLDTGGRITLNLYVDDGSTWDSNASACDAFYLMLARRFTITNDPGVFFLGLDHIDHHSGALTLCSRTYILSLCKRELPRPLTEYKDMQVVSDPRLMEFYESAFHLHQPPTRSFGEKYRSLVGGMGWVAPTTRPDALFTIGIYQRAYTFPTDDLYGCAIGTLVYLGQTAEMGLNFSASAPNAGALRAAVDSDWSVRRSTSGGALLLAGTTPHAVSRRQDCSAESSTAAELVAASTFVGDIAYGVNVGVLLERRAPSGTSRYTLYRLYSREAVV